MNEQKQPDHELDETAEFDVPAELREPDQLQLFPPYPWIVTVFPREPES